MKKVSLLLLSALISFLCFSQVTTEKKVFHYLLPEFREAIVKFKTGKIQEASMNYNTVTEEMIYRVNGRMLAVDRLESIDSIIMEDKVFIPFGNKFYEQIFHGKIPLFVQHKTNLSPAGKPAGYGGTSQTAAVTSIKNISTTGGIYELKLPEDVVVTDASLYWIIWNNKMESFLNERQLLRIIPEKKNEVKMFLREHKINFKKTEDMVLLMRYLNKLL